MIIKGIKFPELKVPEEMKLNIRKQIIETQRLRKIIFAKQGKGKEE